MLTKHKKKLDKNGSLGDKPRTGKYLKCLICGKEFYRKPFGVSTAKYCSYNCSSIGQRNRVKKICYWCGKLFERTVSFTQNRNPKSKNYYCSTKCSAKGVARENKGKIRVEILNIRNADNLFSNYIRNRDDWTCRYCGKEFRDKTGQLHNSHFWSRKNWSTRFDPDNCIAACYSCHKWKLETEKQGVYKDLMIEWLGQEKYNTLKNKSKIIMSKRDSILEFMRWIKPLLKDMDVPKKRKAMIENSDGMTYYD